MDIKRSIVLLAGIAFGLTAGAAPTSEGSAAALKGSQTITLAADEDGNYVYYLKATLKRSNAYTVYTTGLDADAGVTLDVYPKESTKDDVMEPSAYFDEVDEDGGNIRQVMYSDAWYVDEDDPSESDPKSWTYYFVFEGDEPTKFTVNFTSGIQIPVGRLDNPRSITPAKSVARVDANLVMNGEYYFRAKLTEGRLYRFGSTGGSSSTAFSVNIEAEEDDFTRYEDPEYADATYDSGFYVTPTSTGNYLIVVSGSGENENASFGLVYQLIDARAIASHPSAAVSVGSSAEFTAGYKSNTFKNQAYDEIIDESLFSVSAVKGQRFVAYTTGAKTNLLMRIYDKSGKTLLENAGDGYGMDVKCAFEAPENGLCYIGVCQNIADEFTTAPAYTKATLHLEDASAVDGSPDEWDVADDTNAGASGLVALPATSADTPSDVDAEGHGYHALDATDWADTFVIAARKDITYALQVSLENPSEARNTLKATVYTLNGTTERVVTSVNGNINAGSSAPLSFKATANAAYYVRLTVAEGQGLDFPNYKVHAIAYTTSGAALGILTVNTPGAPSATWSIGSESVKYPSGSSVLVSGTQTIKFSKVAGYNAEVSSKTVTVVPGTAPTVVEVVYSDTFDPKDDTVAGATSVSFKNVDTVYATRTLWKGDKADNFAFDGKDGYYYDIALRNVEGNDVTFSISNAGKTLVEGVTSVSQMAMPKTSSKYYVTVVNGAGASVYGGYTLAGKFADVGAIKFAKTAVNAKEDAASVVLTVNRTAKDGYVRVKYGTVAGSALPGEDYVAQNGVLEWANGDNKAKTITVKLIPDLVPFYEGNKTFSVRLAAFGGDELAPGEYPVSIVGGDSCLVTLTETTKPGTTPESAYAKKAPKMATVKTEAVPLETGSFYGVLEEDGSALTNGLPALASIAFTASTASPAALSAKVALAGKTYTFSAKGWDDDAPDGFCTKEFLLDQKVNRINEETGKSESAVVTSTLRVTVASGATAATGDWLKAGGTVELVMNVPDANNKGYQEDIRYVGAIYRDNSKIQDYLTAVTNFTGYYTVALAPEGVSPADGVPAGNGYLTLTIDNKGAVKAAGMLADGATKPSLTAKACALVPDEESSNGYSMIVPLFSVKAPAVFGGELRLYADESGKVVVDSSRALSWNNDNAKLTYAGEEGYALALDPVGGFYDTVVNLQAYYRNHLFEVETSDISEFPLENLPAGYAFATSVEPNGTPVSLGGDTFSTDKRSLVKNGKLYDLVASVNPCNVQVKVARATGLVSGSFSLWSESAAGSAQKELTGFKHNGVLVLSRDKFSPLSDEVAAAGFCFKAVKVTDVNEDTGKTSTRNWTFSLPFNLLAIDQGEIDPWADDWGE